MKILVLSDRPPQGLKSADAYETRLAGLRLGLEANGAQTDLLSLRALRVRGPHLLFWLNAREIARRRRRSCSTATWRFSMCTATN